MNLIYKNYICDNGLKNAGRNRKVPSPEDFPGLNSADTGDISFLYIYVSIVLLNQRDCSWIYRINEIIMKACVTNKKEKKLRFWPPNLPKLIFYIAHFLPCLVYGHQLLDPLTLNKKASIFQVVSDDLMYGIKDCHYCVLFQVFGRTLLAAGQVADQVSHGIAP